jgi:hypothetical protein
MSDLQREVNAAIAQVVTDEGMAGAMRTILRPIVEHLEALPAPLMQASVSATEAAFRQGWLAGIILARHAMCPHCAAGRRFDLPDRPWHHIDGDRRTICRARPIIEASERTTDG